MGVVYIISSPRIKKKSTTPTTFGKESFVFLHLGFRSRHLVSFAEGKKVLYYVRACVEGEGRGRGSERAAARRFAVRIVCEYLGVWMGDPVSFVPV